MELRRAGRRRAALLLNIFKVLVLGVSLFFAALVLAEGWSRSSVEHGRQLRTGWGLYDHYVLRSRAQQALAQKDPRRAATLARQAVAIAPFDQVSLRIAGLAAAEAGDPLEAARLLLNASNLSWRDPGVQTWLVGFYQLLGDPSSAARHADALARMEEFRRAGLAVLADLVTTPDGRAAVAARLAARPPWRLDLLSELSKSKSVEGSAVTSLLADLEAKKARPSPEEVGPIIEGLISRGEGVAAWRYWRARYPLPAGQLIDDQRFERSAAALIGSGPAEPFGWTTGNTGAQLTANKDGEGRSGLAIEYSGNRQANIIQRHTVLQPGSYQAALVFTSDAGAAERVQIDTFCDAVRLASGEGFVTRLGDGHMKRVAFDVPTGCSVVRLGISLEGSESGASGTLFLRSASLSKRGG